MEMRLIIEIGVLACIVICGLYLLTRRRLNDHWLPVIDETGKVYGKVTRSISDASGTKYLHPVMRIALIHKGMLFLKENSAQQLDYPFESCLKYKETLEEGAARIFRENGELNSLPYRCVFRYLFNNGKINRLIYLYLSNIQDESFLRQIHLDSGKWWVGKHIEENLGTGLFSEYFEKEYGSLSHVLVADRMMHGIEA
jgi:hypothetical protein